MNKKINFLLNIIVCCLAESCSAQLSEADQKPEAVKKNSSEKIIRFYYDNEDLVDVINTLAALKEVNVILPVGPNAIAPETKLTLHMREKITLDQAWNHLYTILDVAGYSMIAREKNTFEITKTTNDVVKSALPVYFDVDPENLPNSEQRIRYLHFMSNVKVSDAAESELSGLLTNLLPTGTAIFKVDPASNALIITAKANDIKSVMRIVKLLEKSTYQEKMEPIKLQHILASTVATLFNEPEKGILKTPERQRYGADTKSPTEVTYFSKYVKIIPDDRLNMVIVVGREEAVDRIKEFIQKYIDVPLDSGKSVLHVHQLQYLNAESFAPILQNIVQYAPASATGQVQAEGATPAAIERYFDGVIVKSDAPAAAASGPEGEQGIGGVFKGNNNLVVAARNADWARIKKLIEDLDVPQPQVILQVLVADLTLSDLRALGTWLRNPEKWGFPKGFDFQAANLPVPTVMVNDKNDPTTLAADLLQQYYGKSGDESYAQLVDPASNSTLVAFSDCTSCWTWALLQFINTCGYRKVFSLPHIIAVNNKKAEIVIGSERLVVGAGVGNQGGSTTATKEWVKANLNIKLVPRIAFGETADRLTLDITVAITDFEDAIDITNANRLTRDFRTISIVKSGDVIALGGLARLTDAKSNVETPILGKIPILGYFFKNRKTDSPKENLTVFIKPTIVMPKLRGGMGEYTQDYIKLTKRYTKEGGLFESLKDPITRWFFKPESKIEKSIDDFVAVDEMKNQEITEPVSKRTEVVSSNEPSNKETSKKTLKNRRHSKVAARRSRGLFGGKSEDKLERLLADQKNPFGQA